MGVLGILVQTEFGLPLYIEMFNPKLEKFQEMDMSLTAGFLTAINMFTKQYEMNLGHIKLHKDAKDVYGINMIASKMGEFLILCFVEPFLYHEIVREKLGWIYQRILQPHEDTVKKGKIPTLKDEEKVWIGDILQDLYFKALISANKGTIDSLLGKLFMKYVGIYGISINSFDNSILYFSGIEEETFKLFLNNLGRRSSIIKEYEAIDSYVSIPDYQICRVYALNPGIKMQIQDVMTNIPERTVSFYYYIIADPELEIQPVINELIELLNPFLASVDTS
ncbi:MAG: hypothetical protein HWN65_00200 [Candidatus Helarchaeota archaeon]|nr:hypothetical protein [Candidatus Helarchaeota archaeon]